MIAKLGFVPAVNVSSGAWVAKALFGVGMYAAALGSPGCALL